jgi:Abnormal spindle-like microcephaly-assoc'd, ASPM-SPD-2-Hydin
MTNRMFELKCICLAERCRATGLVSRVRRQLRRDARRVCVLAACLAAGLAACVVSGAQQGEPGAKTASAGGAAIRQSNLPPRVVEAERFLRERGWAAGGRIPPRGLALRSHPTALSNGANVAPAAAPSSATWQPLGPTAVSTASYGLVTGRVSALALDPSDATGNRLFVGTTGGGVWAASNAGTTTTSSIVFTPLTDSVAALAGAGDASISIGALTVQPGETGVILAGTGDPNDALDSYYGAGILRSTDGGNTWSLITQTSDTEQGLSAIDARFTGLGFAGFAWSRANPQLVVAAVTEAYESTLVDADLEPASYQGLYYSLDSGATWHLATITDGAGAVVQGPQGQIESNEGNAATAVEWNPVRQLFVAAVQFHGYYQSADGVTWTRLASQPGAGLTTAMCPTNASATGSEACPIFRGALAVNPVSGDTFAWTVDLNDQDQGLWQDQCAISSGACTNTAVSFGTEWNTAPLESSTLQGPVTIADGVYNLALAAVPAEQDTLVMAGANDLWKCSLAAGCEWRNTTNSTTCMSAQVSEFQHAIAWNAANPLEIFLGNDSGLWRSTDAIGETGPACSASDATHFENLNGSLGSLAEVESLSPLVGSPYVLMAGLGVNGTAGVKGSAVTTDWPQILSGYGGPVAVDAREPDNWYVNDEAGVAIYACQQSAPCTPASFGASPVVTDADVGGDGDAMPTPAPFLVDPADSTQLLIGTCRVWRGPADGSGWSAENAISPVLDSGATGVACNGDALVRSMAAMELANGSELIYVGMYGAAFNGANLAGHVLSATFNPAANGPGGAQPGWTDLTMSPVINGAYGLNAFGLAISSITIDSHDTTGNTVYVTVEGMKTETEPVSVVYRSTNGGATWTDLTSNLPAAPANSLAVDPQNANTVYVATDAGVFFTTEAASCGGVQSDCWAAFGSGLPGAPAVGLSASASTNAQQVLVAATYGRGIWMTPLWSASTAITAATATPANVAFTAMPAVGAASAPLAVQIENTGSLPLTVTSISMGGADPGDFSETDDCVAPPASAVAAGASCIINVVFTPQAGGVERTAVMTIYANVYGGQLTVDLSGTGSAATTAVTVSPGVVNFAPVEVGATSAPLPVTVTNGTAAAVAVSSIVATAPFSIASNACGTSSLAANASCQIELEFAPTVAGAATGLLTLNDAAGTQTVELTGTGPAPPTDILNPATLTFAATAQGQLSAAQEVTITNTGDLPLTGITVTASAQFTATSSFVTQIAAHAVGTINVQFAPTQLGAVSGTLTVTDALKSQTVALSGTGVTAPAFSVTPASLTFTNQQPGVASAAQTISVTNSGGAPLASVGLAITGPAAASYSILSTTCGAVLNGGASCAVQIVFTPNATGAIAATLNISSSTQGVAPVAVALNGSGQLATGLATNPAAINFAVLGAGQASAAQMVTVTNSSSYAIGGVSLATAPPFTIAENNCTGSLSAGANCSASVIFQPTVGGPSSGALTVSSSAVAAPATVALTGTGFDFSLSVTGPASVTVASGQQADFTLVIEPAGANATFTFACGTLPADAVCQFNPASQTLNAGVVGNVEVEVSTGGAAGAAASGARGKSSANVERASFWSDAPLLCGALLLFLKKRRRMIWLVLLAAVLMGSVTSCVSSGGGTGATGGSSGGGSNTAPGTYTIPVTVTSTGVSHATTLTVTVD